MPLSLPFWTIAFLLLLKPIITTALTCQTYPYQPDSKLNPLYAHSVLPIEFLFVPDFGNQEIPITAQLTVAKAFSCLLPDVPTVNAHAILFDQDEAVGDIVAIRNLSDAKMAAFGSAYKKIVKNQSICDVLMNALSVAHGQFDPRFWKLSVKNFVFIRPKGDYGSDCKDELDIWTLNMGLAPAGIFVHVLNIGNSNHLKTNFDDFSRINLDPRIFRGHALELHRSNFWMLKPMIKLNLRAFAHVIGSTSRTFSRGYDALLQRHNLIRFDEVAFVAPSVSPTLTKLQQFKNMLIRLAIMCFFASIGSTLFCCICILSNACCHVFREVHDLELMEIHGPELPPPNQTPRSPHTPVCHCTSPVGPSPSESPNIEAEVDIRTDQTQESDVNVRTV
uniref:Transmembrane protein n=1 Tax=Panagrellus redivivus TaxID=6233 RepID=A0A7E4UV59_PANRE